MSSAAPQTNSVGADDLFQRAELWPVRIHLGTIEGFTLWGTGQADDELDRVLVSSGKLVLLESQRRLQQCIATSAANSLRTFTGWSLLRDGLQHSPASWLEPALDIDYGELASALASRTRWSRSQSIHLLDGLNLLSDIARTLELEEVLASLRVPAIVGALDRLTFLDEATQHVDPASLRASELELIVRRSLKVLDTRVTTDPWRTAEPRT